MHMPRRGFRGSWSKFACWNSFEARFSKSIEHQTAKLNSYQLQFNDPWDLRRHRSSFSGLHLRVSGASAYESYHNTTSLKARYDGNMIARMQRGEAQKLQISSK